MVVINCCCKSSVDVVANGVAPAKAIGVTNVKRDGATALRVRLWRCLDARQTASFVLLARDAPDLDAPRPRAASSEGPSDAAECPGSGCGDAETLLIRACRLGAATETRILLERGANPNLRCKAGATALLHSVCADSSACTRALLADHRTDVNAQDRSGYDALHLCTYDASWEIKDKQGRLECIKLLLEHAGYLPNKVNRWGQTPIICAAQRFYEERVKVILEYGKDKIDIDWRFYSGGFIRTMLQSKFPKICLPSRRVENPLSNDVNIRLLANLQLKNIEIFKSVLEKESPDLNHFYSDPYYCTIIELACRIPGYENFVELILKAGGDPNIRNKVDGNPLIHQAAECANYKALNILLATGIVDITVLNKTYEETVLHVATQSTSPEEEELRALENTVNLLLDYKHYRDYFSDTEPSIVDINAEDEGGDTALHNSTYYGLDSLSLLLIRRGASMTQENLSGQAPVAYMSESVLLTHLNEQIDSNRLSPQNDDFELIVCYDTLVETPSDEDDTAEMRTMNYFVESNDLRPVLLHPLVQMFLYLKWHNVKNYFMYNLLAYLLFVVTLTSYSVLLNVHNFQLESYFNCTEMVEAQESMEEYPQNPNTMTSPTEQTFPGDHTNFSQEGLHLNFDDCDKYLTDADKRTIIILMLMQLLISIFILFILIREGAQIIILKQNYFLSVENLMEIFLIVGTCVVLFEDLIEEKIIRHISGLLILVAWTELILISGKLPYLSIQLEMFKKVCVTFVRFMAWYSLIILAFAFSFFVLFHGDEKFFSDPGISIVKTVVMLAGEFEASDLEFKSAPGTSHIIFLVFVCLIAIVLLNLLNGLAVYDTQAIKDDAKILSLVSMVHLVNYIEQFLKKILFFSRKCKLKKLECFLKKKLYLFNPSVEKKQLHIFPGSGEIRFFLDAENTNRFKNYKIVQSITDAATDIVIKKNQEDDLKKIGSVVSNFGERLTAIEEILQKINLKFDLPG